MTTPDESPESAPAPPEVSFRQGGSTRERVPPTVEKVVEPAVVIEKPEVGPRRHLTWVTIGVALAVIVIDQVTKALVVAYLKPRVLAGEDSIDLLGPVLRLTYTENKGMAFGLGTGFTWIFAVIAVAVAIVVLRTSRKLGSVAWAIALGGLLGGSVGNLIDRLTRPPGPGQGYVVDFLQLPNWPIFNCADMAIVGSAILMVILTIRGVEITGRTPIPNQE